MHLALETKLKISITSLSTRRLCLIHLLLLSHHCMQLKQQLQAYIEKNQLHKPAIIGHSLAALWHFAGI